MVPARIAQALAPWLFGLLLDRWGAQALWVSASIGLLAFTSLWLLRAPAALRPSRLPAAPAQ
jgi:predicted MFS family arabinose efflux permease